jgi:hypothetical protein
MAPEIRRLRDAGCRRILAKVLADNDNSKNQIYLGGSFDILNELPLHTWSSETSGRQGIIRARIDWSWLQPDGALAHAPGAQLILYPQYPEVRLSGILRGTSRGGAPSEIIARRQAGRVLLLGLRDGGDVVALAIDADDSGAARLRSLLDGRSGPGALVEAARFGVADEEIRDDRSRLLDALRRIRDRGWTDGQRMLGDGTIIPYDAANGVGYTLEALLGVRPNAVGAPDYLGWEVKALTAGRSGHVASSKRITLMTPNPTGGDLAELGPAAFMRLYGYPDRRSPQRLNFGGTYSARHRTGNRSLQLVLDGFDPKAPSRFSADGAVSLEDPTGHQAMEWSLTKMIGLWNHKHSKAVYLPADADLHGGRRRYRYGSTAYLGTGTDFSRLLLGVAHGEVVYDPGIKLEHAGSDREKAKARHQFRVAFGSLPSLYARWEEIPLESAA